MQTRHTAIAVALEKAQNADRLESIGEYDQALEYYQSAVELLLPLIEGIKYR